MMGPPCKRSRLVDVELLGKDLSVLQRFVELLEGPEGDQLVYEALASKNVLTILKYLETNARRKPSESASIFQVLYVLIMKGARDFDSKFRQVAVGLSEGVLEDPRFAACISSLKAKQNAEVLKSVLRLLSAVATVSPNLARGLLRSIRFDSPELIQCSRRRNKGDEQDVRSCFLNLVGSFVFSEGSIVLRELMDRREALSLAITDSCTDKYENVLLLLEMLRKIITSSAISKTQKIRLFNRNTLKQLLYLYAWRGEAQVEDSEGTKSASVNKTQLTSIRMKLHEVLKILGTSTRQGIIFSVRKRDVCVRPNEILLHALTSPPMEGAYADSLRSELVVLTLSACPDIVQPYVDHISPFLLPRPDSSSWFGAMDLVCQIYHACTNHLVVRCTDAMEHWTNAQQAAQSIVDGCFLSPKIAESVGAALKFSESQEVMDKAHELIRILRKNVVILLTWISTTEEFPTSLFTSEQFKMELRKLIRERMPTTETMQKFDKLFDKTLKDSAILKDQVLPSAPTEVGKCEDDIPETPKPNPLENVGTLDSLPAELRKPLRRFFNCSEEAPLSAKLMKALNVLPEITNVCISNYFNVPIILRCLAKGFRLARMQGYTELKFDNMNLLDSMLNHWEFPNIILLDPASEARPVADEMDGEVVEENHTSEMITSFLREAVFDLLTELTLLDPEAVLTRVPVLWFLASYNATLSSCDRHILRIIYLMESNSGHLLTRPNDIASVPLTWGPTVLRHYQFNTKARNGQLPVPVTCMAPNLNSLFNMIDEDNLLSSSIRFPMRRPWLGQVNSFSLKAAATEDEQQLYDPCFLLHAVYHYLQQYKSAKTDNSTERFLRRFYTSNCLAFAVAGLTSYSKHLRSIARSVIAEYRSLALAWKPVKGKEVQNDQSSLFSSVFPERPQVLFILDTIRNSLATGGGLALGGGSRKRWMLSSPLDTGGRLTKVHANFFIRALQLLSKPENCMYQSIWNCLLSKPAIDLTRVPDFLRNFFSTSNMFRVERQWISRLCAESLGDTADYLVMENSHVFKHMLGVYSSPSSDPTFQLYILQLLRSATSHPRLCHTLTRFHAIPLWLWRNALSTGSAAHVKHFRAIIDHMLAAFSGQPEESPSLVVVRLLSEEFQKMHGVSRLSKSDSCMVNPPVDDMTETI